MKQKDPVVFAEHALLYGVKEEVPDEFFEIPFRRDHKPQVPRYNSEMTNNSRALCLEYFLYMCRDKCLKGESNFRVNNIVKGIIFFIIFLASEFFHVFNQLKSDI